MMFSFHLLGLHSTSISASKHNDGPSGLVRIKGWSETLRRLKAVTFTVTDGETRLSWTRTLTSTQDEAGVEPFDLNIPRDSIANRISVTAYFLKENPGEESHGVVHLTVETETSCVAHDGALLYQDISIASGIEPYYSVPLEVEIDQSSTFSKAKLFIRNPPHIVTHWKISIKRTSTRSAADKSKHVFFLSKSIADTGQQEFQFPVSFRGGGNYKAVVHGLLVSDQTSSLSNNEYKLLFGNSTEFKTELTLDDIASLHSKAVEHAKWYGDSLCVHFYRNKPQHYFDDIFANHGGIMEVYIKDNSGDPGSPINGKLNGLFFMASVEPGTVTGVPVARSAFGSTRLLVRTTELLSTTPNVYFADFYCMRGQYHYVTLVLTKPYSENDRFCANRLLRLSLHDKTSNPFLFYDDRGQLRVSTRDHLHVELLFTENFDLNRYRSTLQRYTPLIGKGQTTPGGIPKNPTCTTCNLSSPAKSPSFASFFDNPMNPF